MKNTKAIGLLILAVLAGLAAAVYGTRWLGERGNLAATRVVVAAADIELGTKIVPQMLTTAEWPADSVPPGAFEDPKALGDRVTRTSILRGEAVVERKLSPPGTNGGLSAVIAEGKRAMTVRVNDVVGVAGFALPGNYVDVMVNMQQDHAAGQAPTPVSMTVLEHVLVLAVAQEAGRDDTKPKVVNAVTLELPLQDAEKLDLARSVGTLSLVLRNQLDTKTASTKGISKAELVAIRAAAVASAPAPAAPKPRRIAVARAEQKAMGMPVARLCTEVIRQGTRSLECF